MTEENQTKPKSSEGGWGYVVVAGVFLIYFLVLGYFQIQTFFYVEWQREFNTSSAETSFLVSMNTFVFGLSSKFIYLCLSLKIQ